MNICLRKKIALWASFLGTFTLLSACSKGETGTHGGGDNPVPPPASGSVRFDGLTRIDSIEGTPASITINIVNDGADSITNLDLKIINPDTKEPSTAPLAIENDHCSGKSLEAKSKCSFDVTLTPDQSKKLLKKILTDKTQTLELDYMSLGQSKTLLEDLTYSIQPLFAAFPSAITLSAIVSGSISDGDNTGATEQPIYGSNATVVLYNRSKSSQVTNITFPSLADKGITIDPHYCGTKNLNAKNICAFEVIYKPTQAVSGNSNATINIGYTLNGKQGNLPIVINYSTVEKKVDSNLYGNLLSQMNLKAARFAVINNCNEKVWLANKPLPTFGPHGIIEKDQPVEKGGYFIFDDLYARSLFNTDPKGKSVESDFTLAKGFPAVNFYAKFDCKNDKGQDCKIGQVVGKDTLSPDQVCDPQHGCQPDAITKFEMSFGCTYDDTTKCSKNPSDPTQPLGRGSFLDGTFLDGFSNNIAIDIFPGSAQENPQCFSVPDSKLDINASLNDPDFPLSKENLTSVSEQWSLMRTDSHNVDKWTWSDTTPPQGWAPSEIGSPINLIGQDNWNQGISDLRKMISKWNDNGDPSNATFQAYNDIDPSKNTFLAVPKHVSCFDSKFDQSEANQENTANNCKVKTDDPNKRCLPTTQIDLTSHSLLIQARNPSTGTIDSSGKLLSVAGPGQMLSANRTWGGLGLGSQCLYVGGHAFETGAINDATSPFYPTYFDRDVQFKMPSDASESVGGLTTSFAIAYNNLTLMYLNPYNNAGLAVRDSDNDNSTVSKSAYVYQQLRQFCVGHPGFCVKSDDKKDGIGGLAALFGNMGPVNDTNFVKYVRKNAPGYYSWQYDDYNATRVCADPKTKIVLTLCGKDADTPKFPVNSKKTITSPFDTVPQPHTTPR